MVQVKDLEKLMDDFMIEPDEKFSELRRYLLSEFKWDIDPQKKAHFMIRGIPIDENKKLGDILKAYLPDEVIVLREI